MSASDDARRLADRITEMERALDAAERENIRLDRDLNEHCDIIEGLRTTARAAGLREQARIALELAGQYLAEGDDIVTSRRLQDTLLQAVACAAEAKEAA